MKRKVQFEHGHNCRDYECAFDSTECRKGSEGYHGISGMNVRFMVIGEKGVVQFVMSLPSMVPSEDAGEPMPFKNGPTPYGTDLGYHAYEPQFEGQTPQDSCKFLDGKPCYYDGSSLNADAPLKTLINAGEDALWEFLEKYYNCLFCDGEYPQAAEYHKSLR